MEKTEKEWQDNDTDSLMDILYDYIRHWKWFILSVVLCLITSIIVIKSTQKQYKSSISVLLNEDKNKGGGNTSGLLSLDELGLLSSTNNIDNEIAILTSFDLIANVVDTLNLQTAYYLNDGLRVRELYSDTPFYVTYEDNNEDSDSFDRIDFQLIKTGGNFDITGEYFSLDGSKVKFDQQVEKFPVKIHLPDKIGTINISSTGEKIIDAEKYYITITNTINVIENLKKDLTVTQTSKNSSALNISLLVGNTEKGAAILRELVHKYNVQNVKVNNEITRNTSRFIEERLKEIALELGDVESEVVDYKQQNQIADLASEAQLSIKQSGENRERLMEIETQLGVIRMIDRFVNNPANKFEIIPNLGISDPTLSQIISEYNNKILDSDALLKNTGKENPMRIRVIGEIENMRSNISNSLKNVTQAYTISKQDLQRLSGTTMSHIRSIPQQEKGLLEKVRQQQVKEALFLFLMQKREETNISIASIADKARIIASPQIRIPTVVPKTNVILLAALIIGVLIPIVVIYIINLLKTNISNRTELEKLSNVSVIGQIDISKTRDKIIVQHNPNSSTTEMFRSLRNNLNFILKNEVHRTILVTSTTTGEGKTFISVNLAMTYALSGKKVLLIGADIRKPRLKEYLDIDTRRGLTDYLISNDDNWKEYVNKSALHSNLNVMISGVIPPNPNELLMTSKLSTLLAQVKAEYDIVILDTAPVGMVSDTYLIDKFIDITLYVVRENVTPKNAINFINIQKQEDRLANMYLVLNSSSLDKYSSYKYGYAKRYGYGEDAKE